MRATLKSTWDPSFSVFIDPARLLLALDIRPVVGEDEVLVTVQKLIDQRLKEGRVLSREKKPEPIEIDRLFEPPFSS